MISFFMCKLFELDFFFRDGLFAIATFYDDVVLVDYIEYCRHRFVVGDAFGIGTPYDVMQSIGQTYRLFVGYGVVFDDIYFCFGCQNRDFVYIFLFEVCVGDFYDSLFPYFFTTQVIADRNVLIEVVEVE